MSWDRTVTQRQQQQAAASSLHLLHWTNADLNCSTCSCSSWCPTFCWLALDVRQNVLPMSWQQSTHGAHAPILGAAARRQSVSHNPAAHHTCTRGGSSNSNRSSRNPAISMASRCWERMVRASCWRWIGHSNSSSSMRGRMLQVVRMLRCSLAPCLHQ